MSLDVAEIFTISSSESLWSDWNQADKQLINLKSDQREQVTGTFYQNPLVYYGEL